MRCPLCEASDFAIVPLAKPEPVNYHDCLACGFRFMEPAHRLGFRDEHERYHLHENNPDDAGYRDYTLPLIEAIVARRSPHDRGLDFGSGTDSAAHRMLVERGFGALAKYDRFFHPTEENLVPGGYDFVFACEVVEHFHEPRSEFARIRSLLRPGGSFLFMTSLLTPAVDFDRWHYRRDPTHVGFFSERSLGILARALGFAAPKIIAPRVVHLRLAGS